MNADKIGDIQKLIMCDAQTSGGLLFSVPQSLKDQILRELLDSGIENARHIGNCIKKGAGKIVVR